MDDANQTNEQAIVLSNALESESRRVARWAIVCLIFAVAVSVLVIATKSVVFLVVALFAWFFAWNRWKLRRLLTAHLPPPSENQDAWIQNAANELQNPPAWYKFSEYIAAITFLAMFLLITIQVTLTSGTWMRVLYGACWVFIAAVVVARVRNARQKRKGSRLER